MFASLFAMGGFWVSLASTIFAFHKVDSHAALLLVPTQIWATIAAALNFHTYWLNRKAPKDKDGKNSYDSKKGK
jgi:tryptophan-rich sensory protein